MITALEFYGSVSLLETKDIAHDISISRMV